MTEDVGSANALRILLTHVYSWPEVRRGGERYLHEVGAALAKAGHDVTILSTSHHRNHSVVENVPVERFRRRFLPRRFFGAQADEVAFGLQSAPWPLRHRIDVWHALGTADAASATVVGKVLGFRSVHTSLGLPNKEYWRRRPDRHLHDLVARNVDTYICLSSAAAEGLHGGWGRIADVVPGGVDIDRFRPAESRHPRPALLYSGTLSDERKNLRLLLQAVAILRKDYSDLELWLSGPGDPSDQISSSPASARNAIVQLGLGSREEQGGIYGRSWVTVLPSINEAFGLALVESLACGTPIVALAQGGGPAELVRPGIGFTSGPSAAELAEACASAIELACVPDTADACRTASADYDWRRAIVPRIEAIYRTDPERSTGSERS